MKYLCLGYFNKEKMEALPKEEIDAIMLECQPHLEELYKSGHVLVDAGVAQEVKSLQRVGGKIQVGDGHLTQLDKLIGSAFILEAQNIEEAIQVASLHPTVQVSRGEQLGWEIEIRPIDSFDMKD
ncbi:YciI family protein [Planococcus shenhongbingii]|uniref:YciI family protein n=1 Tax=Planococcus shenhongbingii TaxID=3058398 RepID=UPI00260B3053|nr:YciI family protein [Planococcus sp. N016]WKA59296.1 YciI family protein [Planococcus sp. N016]